MTAHGTHRAYALDMTHSISNVYQAKRLQAPWPTEHASPRVMRVALVTLKVVPTVQPACHRMFDRPPTNQYPQRKHETHQDDPALSNATGCQKTDCIPKFMARHPLSEDHSILRRDYFALPSPFLFSIVSMDESKLERSRYDEQARHHPQKLTLSHRLPRWRRAC